MAASLRICMLNGTYYPLVGGAERQMQQYARRLASRGHHLQVITYRVQRNWPRQELVDGVPVTRTGGLYIRGKLRRRWGLALLPLLWALLRQRRQYDVLHVQQSLEVAFAAVLVGKVLGKPVILRLASSGVTNDLRLLAQQNRLLGRWMAGVIRRSNANFVALASTAVAELSAEGIPRARIHWIPNGVDMTTFDLAGRAAPAGPPRAVLCVGHLEHVKGIDVLLRAWRDVVRALPDARLSLVGGGSLHDALAAQARELGIAGSVAFVGQTSDIPRYLQQADCFVLPSRAEGLSNALLEAMAAGLPCVATRVGACGDLIQDGVSGLLVEPEDAAALAQALLAFMTDPTLAQRCARQAQILVEQRYDIEKTVQCYEALYQAVLGEHDQARPAKDQLALQSGRAPRKG